MLYLITTKQDSCFSLKVTESPLHHRLRTLKSFFLILIIFNESNSDAPSLTILDDSDHLSSSNSSACLPPSYQKKPLKRQPEWLLVITLAELPDSTPGRTNLGNLLRTGCSG